MLNEYSFLEYFYVDNGFSYISYREIHEFCLTAVLYILS